MEKRVVHLRAQSAAACKLAVHLIVVCPLEHENCNNSPFLRILGFVYTAGVEVVVSTLAELDALCCDEKHMLYAREVLLDEVVG